MALRIFPWETKWEENRPLCGRSEYLLHSSGFQNQINYLLMGLLSQSRIIVKPKPYGNRKYNAIA